MKVKIYKSNLNGIFNAPPSKSYAHRALIAAGIAGGISQISNLDLSDDIVATINAIRELGADVSDIIDNKVYIKGIGNVISQSNLKQKIFDVNECGSTYRFFIPIALSIYDNVVFKGTKKLISRPITPYENIFRKQRIIYNIKNDKLIIKGHLKGAKFELAGNISSQFITGLLFAMTLLKEKSEIVVQKPIESLPYIYITIDMLKKFGINIIEIDKDDSIVLKIDEDSRFKPINYQIEGDFSNAAFFEAMAYDNYIKIEGLNNNSIQGDKVYKLLFEKIRNREFPIDISNTPDLAPVLFVVAALCGYGKFIGTKRLKIKESDRAYAMKEELSKFGIDVVIMDNSVIIKGIIENRKDIVIDSHNDHRIAMAMSIILLKTGGIIENAECVKKSFPLFYDELVKLGCRLLKQTN